MAKNPYNQYTDSTEVFILRYRPLSSFTPPILRALAKQIILLYQHTASQISQLRNLTS